METNVNTFKTLLYYSYKELTAVILNGVNGQNVLLPAAEVWDRVLGHVLIRLRKTAEKLA